MVPLSFPDARLLLFARAPELGRVKTRLARRVGDAAALALYTAWLEGALRRLVDARLAPLECWCTPDCAHPFFQSWGDVVRFRRQRDGNLGERMFHAAETALREARMVVLLGADCPDLDGAYLERALRALERGCDLVLGPALDGGYVLLGLRHAERGLFDGIAWGGREVAATTLARASALGLGSHCLSPLRDIDEYEDLVAWSARLNGL